VSTNATASARIDVPPDAVWRRGSFLLGSVAGLTLAAWASAWLSWPAWAAAAALATMASAGAAFGLRVLRAPVGTLSRQVEAWWWHHAGHTDMSPEGGTRGDVIVTIDLGRWMLVRFEPLAATDDLEPRRRRRTLWLPLSAVVGGPAWSAWRALLLSRRATLPDRLRQAARGVASADR
jgi:hypothetical protein